MAIVWCVVFVYVGALLAGIMHIFTRYTNIRYSNNNLNIAEGIILLAHKDPPGYN